MKPLSKNYYLRIFGFAIYFFISDPVLADVPISNAPQSILQTVAPGSTATNLSIPLDESSLLAIDVIVPANGASAQLVDPSGTIVARSTDANVIVLDGANLSTPQPGARYQFPVISSPSSGIWQIKTQFQATSDSFPVVALVVANNKSVLQLHVLPEETIAGVPVNVSLAAFREEIPMLDLPISITATRANAAPLSFNLADNGQNFDSAAGDGLYGKIITLPDAGEYLITATTQVPTPTGTQTRQVTQSLTVKEPIIAINNLNAEPILGTSNCIEGYTVSVDANVTRSGDYRIQADFVSGSEIQTFRDQRAMTTGVQTIVLTVPKALLRPLHETHDKIFLAGIKGVDSHKDSDPSGALVMLSNQGIRLTDLEQGNFCEGNISIVEPPRLSLLNQTKFIFGVGLTTTVDAPSAGRYKIDLSFVDNLGHPVIQRSLTQQLKAGTNQILHGEVPKSFLTSDGPYRLSNLKITGAAGQTLSLPTASTASASKWQMQPSIVGDLNADGKVDDSDVKIVTGFRGQTPYSNGDRRDLDNDGKITILDARIIATKKCGLGSCLPAPVVP